MIHAGDVDDEGQLIVDELLRYCGYRGRVQRLYTSDTSTAALRKRLGMLEDNAKWEPLGISAYARSVTDKTFGINFSRLYTKLNGTLLTVGRVQTPAMGLVVARDEAIENHVVRKYYALEAEAEIDGRQPPIRAEFAPTKGSPLLGEEDKVWDSKGLAAVLAECKGKKFPARGSRLSSALAAMIRRPAHCPALQREITRRASRMAALRSMKQRRRAGIPKRRLLPT